MVLGSTAVVIDHDTGELVEASTYQPYGGVESDYRPSRWGSFRDDVRYTSHWDDAEVGLVYMNARYYSPALGRFISPDPQAIQVATGDLNPYAYAMGSPLRYADSTGLAPDPQSVSDLNDTLVVGNALDVGADMTGLARNVLNMFDTVAGTDLNSALGTGNIEQNLTNEANGLRADAIQEAIDTYHINTSDVLSGPEYGPQLPDAASSTLNRWHKIDVTLGPDAFSSPSWLGESIGHEAEVHGLQARQGRFYKDPLGMALDEVEAYGYGLTAANRDRFGLKPDEIRALQTEYTNAYNTVIDLGGAAYGPRIRVGNFGLIPGTLSP